jgi:hypothetical protein
MTGKACGVNEMLCHFMNDHRFIKLTKLTDHFIFYSSAGKYWAQHPQHTGIVAKHIIFADKL